MALLYIRYADGSIKNLYSMDPGDFLTNHNLMFARAHFDEVKQSVLSTAPGDASIAMHTIDVKQAMDSIWMELKYMQWNSKASGVSPIVVQPNNQDSEWLYKFMIVMLRLRVEYETECKDGLPELQFAVNESVCKKINHWMNVLKPNGANQMVHPAHLVAFARLIHAQRPTNV